MKTDGKGKYPVRLVCYVSEHQDDVLDDMAELMGIAKSELIRNALSQYVFAYHEAIALMRDKVDDLLAEGSGFAAEPGTAATGTK